VTPYTVDSRDRVLDAVDMIALVNTRTEMRRAGVNSYFGRCPFHDERTGSFHVSPDEKLYHCFGCQASGNPFDFVMETEGLDFKAALEALAGRFGVQLETEDEDPAAASRRQRRERLYTLLGRAATYYARNLWEAGEAGAAREYLLRRGLGEDTLREFRVGYAPSAWDRLLRASRCAGFSDEELQATGLVQRSKTGSGQVFDRFRERITFPSVDARGRVVGFGARSMRDDQPPKYLNTSDGEVYHKRSQLFGIDLARAAAARAGRMILVEGYTDVLALHQAGMRNAVGIMGTSLTDEQVAELGRIVGVLELCLDSDRAGQDAMLRASRIAAGRNLELRVVELPEAHDPAEIVEREGSEALRARVEASVPFVVFHVERILDRSDTRSAEGRDRAIAELRPVVGELPASVLRDELMRRIAGRLELSESRLTMLFARGVREADRRSAAAAPAAANSPLVLRLDGGLRHERAFLALCLAQPLAGAEMLGSIDPDELLTSEVYRRAARHLAGRTDSPMSELPVDDDQLARTIADLVDRAGRAPHASEAELQHARLLLELSRLDRAVARARATGTPGIGDLARKREQVREAIHSVVMRMESTV
jgi:DNA primase